MTDTSNMTDEEYLDHLSDMEIQLKSLNENYALLRRERSELGYVVSRIEDHKVRNIARLGLPVQQEKIEEAIRKNRARARDILADLHREYALLASAGGKWTPAVGHNGPKPKDPVE